MKFPWNVASWKQFIFFQLEKEGKRKKSENEQVWVKGLFATSFSNPWMCFWPILLELAGGLEGRNHLQMGQLFLKLPKILLLFMHVLFMSSNDNMFDLVLLNNQHSHQSSDHLCWNLDNYILMNSSVLILMVIIPMTSITIRILFITSIIKIIFLVTKIKSSLAMFHSRPASVGEDPRALSARHQQQCCNNIRIHRQYIVLTFLVNIKHILLLTWHPFH